MKGAIVQVTSACNLRCNSCQTYLSKPEFLKWDREWLRDLRKQGFWYLSLTGGEPTLHPDIVKMLQAMKELGFITHTATNGTNPEKIKEMTEYLDAISISLDDYMPDAHNQFRGRKIFAEAVESARYVKGKTKIATVNMLVTEDNAERVLQMAEFTNSEIGLPLSLCFPDNASYVFNKNFSVSHKKIQTAFQVAYSNYRKYVFGNTREYYRQCVEYLSGNKVSRCRAGEAIFYIDVKGKLNACFKHEKPPRNCNECFIQCFREPSLFNPLAHMGVFVRSYLKGKKPV
ncbi:MAG: radical SAM protein [Thermoplasmata archaeon]|nr:radical SAM protein [Thermoplasmata archaeon]